MRELGEGENEVGFVDDLSGGEDSCMATRGRGRREAAAARAEEMEVTAVS